MTEAQLKRRLRYWMEELSTLGIQHYEFTVSIVDIPDFGERDDAFAAISVSDLYDDFDLQVSQSYLQEHDLEDVDRLLIHELCHIPFHRLMMTSKLSLDSMAPAAASVVDGLLDQHMEDVVEKFARTLHTIHER